MEKQFEQKFIAFIDILGFKNFVYKAEDDQEVNLQDLIEFTSILHNQEGYQNILEHGPSICPKSHRIRKDLNLVVTQVSDCVIISCEVSPAGLINLISNSWVSIFRLMEKGIMCRGFITRGQIYHQGNQIFGTGYLKALEMEHSNIQAFKKEAGETGTPFVEIDEIVKVYADEQDDDCLNKTFNQYTKTAENFTALFPFQQISFILNSSVSSVGFREKNSKKYCELMRKNIEDFKNEINNYVHNSSEKAKAKADYYLGFLNTQLEQINRMEDDIDFLNSPFGNEGL